MPYAVRKHGNSYQVVNTASGAVHAKHTSKQNAQRQLRLLQQLERDKEKS